MKLWVSMSAAMYLDMLEQNLEHINADIEQDVDPVFEDLDKSPIPVFHFGRTTMCSSVFFNYNYLLRGGRHMSQKDVPDNVLRYFIFRSDDLIKNLSSAPLGFLDLIVDNSHHVRDVLGIYRAFVTDEFMDIGVREEIITSLVKTVEHALDVHTVDENVLRVLSNLGATDDQTGGPVTLKTKVARLPYDIDALTHKAEISKSERRRPWLRQKYDGER